MLEWMIAITAVCGAISGLAILYITLRAAMHVRSDFAVRRTVRVRMCGHARDSGNGEVLPRATVHRVSPTLGLRRCRRFTVPRRT
jgi:hypothetical protein